jgi:hypothetical protein
MMNSKTVAGIFLEERTEGWGITCSADPLVRSIVRSLVRVTCKFLPRRVLSRCECGLLRCSKIEQGKNYCACCCYFVATPTLESDQQQ